MGRRRRARTAHVGRDAHARRRGGRRGKAWSGYETEAAGHRRNTEHRAPRVWVYQAQGTAEGKP